MAGSNAGEYTFKKKDKVVTMSKAPKVLIDDEEIQVDPDLLFQRLVALLSIRGYIGLADVLKTEMYVHPPALFEASSSMLQACKHLLADTIWNIYVHPCDELQDNENPGNDDNIEGHDETLLPSDGNLMKSVYTPIIDGGSFLHRIMWPAGITYDDITVLYDKYAQKHYRFPNTVVFDGYKTETTKANTHRRRYKPKSYPVHFDKDMVLSMSKELLLSNKENKARFIQQLGERLSDSGSEVLHADGDADLLIVKTAVDKSQEAIIGVHGEDTDLLVLLIYHSQTDSKTIYFLPGTSKSSNIPRIWNIHEIKAAMGPTTVNSLLFWAALLGSDTTSRIYGIGRGTVFKRHHNEVLFIEIAGVFNDNTSSHEDVAAAGDRALVTIYGGKPNTTLNHLRYTKFHEKVMRATSAVNPKSLPPTSSAALQHSYR
jgi:hypothetical protein